MALWRAAWGQRPTIGPDVAMMEGGAVNPEPRGEVSQEAERGAIMPGERRRRRVGRPELRRRVVDRSRRVGLRRPTSVAA